MSTDRLSGLENKTGVADIRPYSKTLKFIRFFLIIGIIGIVALLFIWPQLSTMEKRPLTREDMNALTQAEKMNTLVKPVFNSRDVNNNPFTVIAAEAIQDRDNQDVVTLTQPTARFFDNNNREINLKADQGLFNQNTKLLQLKENILLTMDLGTIQGNRLIIDQKKQTITFYGPTKAVITMKD
jgi:lipopolysaccharide export system protein LptC